MIINRKDEKKVEIPKYLYRGMRLGYPEMLDFEYVDVDLKMPYEPIIDEYGRKVVSDGNEYGVYMSDNLSMVEYAYGNLHNEGTELRRDIVIGNYRLTIPSVAVIYKINTDGLNVRQPFITDYLKGHYNNGFQGHEFITDYIPAENYDLIRVRIGADLLHDQQDLDLSSLIPIKEQIKNIIEMRKYRLEVFGNAMEQFSSNERRNFQRTEILLFKDIFGENGVRYIPTKDIDTTTPDGMITFLLQREYKKDENNMNLKILKDINSLKGKFKDIDSLLEYLRNKINSTDYNYIISLYTSLINIILIKRNKDNDKSDNNSMNQTPQFNNQSEENKEWEVIKDKYFYDNSSQKSKVDNFSTSNLKKRLEEMKERIEINPSLLDLSEILKQEDLESTEALEQRRRMY